MELSINEMTTLSTAQAAYDKQEKRIFRLSLLLIKNSKVIKGQLEDFEAARKSIFDTPELVKFKEEKQAIINDHRIKKDDGSFDIVEQNGQQGYRLERLPELNAKLQVFDEKNKELTEKEDKGAKELEILFTKKVDVKLQSITKKDDVKSLSKETLMILAPIIKVKLTEDVLGSIAEQLTTTDIEKLEKYCTIG